MVNWKLSKHGISWPVSCDHITGSGFELIKVTCFFKVDCWPSTGFCWIMVSSQVNLLISTRLFRGYNFIVFMLCSLRLLKLKTEVQTLTAMLQKSNKYSHLSWVRLLLDYSNQGHLIKFSTNLMKKIVNVYSSFPTNYPCNQAVHHKGNRFLVILDNLLENHC